MTIARDGKDMAQLSNIFHGEKHFKIAIYNKKMWRLARPDTKNFHKKLQHRRQCDPSAGSDKLINEIG